MTEITILDRYKVLASTGSLGLKLNTFMMDFGLSRIL